MQSNHPKLSFVPPLLPDQTLYSWEAVFHELSGNAAITETRQQLCGGIRGGRHFHMPSHLNTLCARTQLAIGTPEDIVRTTTILPYFTKFRSLSVVATTLRRVRGKSSYGVAQALGMAATESHPHPPRRSCRECIQQDMACLGFAYWRRNHQLPGVLVCQHHRTKLLALPYDHDSISRVNILWPDDDWISVNADRWRDWPTATLDTLHRLSILAVEMANGELVGGYAVQRMKNACIPFLHGRNLITPDGSLDIPLALSSYRSHFAEIATIPEIAAATQGSIRPILSVLGHPRYRVHPLEWMLIIDWLFGNWQTFQECYRRGDVTNGIYLAS